MSVTGTDEPTKAGVAVVDVLTGLHAAVAILGALHHRDRTGEGQRIEVTLLGSLLSSLVNQASGIRGCGCRARGSWGTRTRRSLPTRSSRRPTARWSSPSATMPSSPDSHPCSRPRAWPSTRASRPTRPGSGIATLSRSRSRAGSGGRGADEWQERITAAGVPCGPINDIEQGFALATRLGLEPIRQVDDARRPTPQAQVANPAAYSRTPVTYRSAPPLVGEDRAAVLAMLEAREARS